MANDILFYNRLGRQGKSTISYNGYDYQRRKEIVSKYVTNDIGNISFSVKKLVGEKNLISIKPGDEVQVDTEDQNIFDFGGYADNRVLSVAEFVQKVVIVIAYVSNSELEITAKLIKKLTEYNSNIVVVFNKTKRNKVIRGQRILNNLLNVLDVDLNQIKIFTVNDSEYMTRLADLNQSIYDVADASKGDRSQLNKTIIPQLDELYGYLFPLT